MAEQSVELFPDVITCNASISACEKRKQWQQALGLPRSFDVFFPNSVTYCAAISAREKGEQRQQALDLVVTEQSVELLPDVITCNASINAREKGSNGSRHLACREVSMCSQIQSLTALQSVLVKRVSNGSRHSIYL